MKIIKHDKCCVIVLDNSSKIDSLSSFLSQDESSPQHLIIDLLNTVIEHSIVIETLLPFFRNWQKWNKSFILVSDIKKESLRAMVSIASIEEAFDFFYMQELTRSI